MTKLVYEINYMCMADIKEISSLIRHELLVSIEQISTNVIPSSNLTVNTSLKNTSVFFFHWKGLPLN